VGVRIVIAITIMNVICCGSWRLEMPSQVIRTIPVRFYEGDEELVKFLDSEKKRTGVSLGQLLKNYAEEKRMYAREIPTLSEEGQRMLSRYYDQHILIDSPEVRSAIKQMGKNFCGKINRELHGDDCKRKETLQK
jgi:hypothetical protein